MIGFGSILINILYFLNGSVIFRNKKMLNKNSTVKGRKFTEITRIFFSFYLFLINFLDSSLLTL